MKPYLKKADQKTTYGFIECTECKVTEEINGQYELELVTYSGAVQSDYLLNNNVIYAEHCPDGSIEPFRIYKVQRDIDKKIVVNAQHISYDLCSKIMYLNHEDAWGEPYLMDTQDKVVKLLNERSQKYGWNFTFVNDGATAPEYNPGIGDNSLGSARQYLGECIEKLGGELYFQDRKVTICAHRDKERQYLIKYGLNMTEFSETIDTSNTYSAIWGYWGSGNWANGDAIVFATEISASSSYAADAKKAVQAVDLTEFMGTYPEGEKPTRAEVKAAADKWLAEHEGTITAPSENVTLKHIDLATAFGELEGFEQTQLLLGSTGTILYKDLGIYRKVELIKGVWDVLLGRWDECEFGSKAVDLATALSDSLPGASTSSGAQATIINNINGNGRTYATVAKMIADTGLTENDIVNTKGYYSPGDGGACQYVIYKDKPELHYEKLSNGLYAKPNTGSSINVRQLGAIGDGTRDDYTPIARACYHYQDVFIPEGTYYISMPIIIDSVSGLNLHGQGATLLYNENFIYVNQEPLMFALQKCTNCTVSGIEFLFNPSKTVITSNGSDGKAGTVFSLLNCQYITVDNCKIKAAGSAHNACNAMWIRDGGFDQKTAHIKVTNCDIDNSTWYAAGGALWIMTAQIIYDIQISCCSIYGTNHDEVVAVWTWDEATYAAEADYAIFDSCRIEKNGYTSGGQAVESDAVIASYNENGNAMFNNCFIHCGNIPNWETIKCFGGGKLKVTGCSIKYYQNGSGKLFCALDGSQMDISSNQIFFFHQSHNSGAGNFLEAGGASCGMAANRVSYINGSSSQSACPFLAVDSSSADVSMTGNSFSISGMSGLWNYAGPCHSWQSAGNTFSSNQSLTVTEDSSTSSGYYQTVSNLYAAVSGTSKLM